MKKLKYTAIDLAQSDAEFIRCTSEGEMDYGSYWRKDGELIWCQERPTDAVVSALVQKVGAGNISDGYHTLDELYEHRCLLFIALCNLLPDICHKTRKNFDGDEWAGWFILVLHHPIAGQISYHIPDKYWYSCGVKQVDRNYTYDGHTSSDVLDRLKQF